MARLLQLSDLHVVAPGARASDVLDTRALLRSAIDRLLGSLDAIGPLDAVLVTGDVSDDGSAASYDFARAELGRLDLPLLVVPGNHDQRDALRDAFADAAPMPREGLIDWVADLPGCRIVGLDTLVEGQGGGRLRVETLDLLGEAVRGSPHEALVVALHHPPLRTGIRFMDAIGLENSGALAGCLDGASCFVQVVAGHVHGVYHGRVGRWPVSTAPALCSAFALDRRVEAPVGFWTGPKGCAVIDTGPDGIWTAILLEDADGPYAF
ncbi:metallophosphoesterase [Limibaculum sp. M0105]|uniref:Metallophosphoesterase n=1 Tax=Thermohalobaculum xanthum TaxID=2753746 RepID=A0A8J7SA73_9RHOB|nr:metallophosphoesterase [Thermohalobaculum xanthum]MBK0398162.1 metallophosphoesterase [Thermohalobaculum xanthum]